MGTWNPYSYPTEPPSKPEWLERREEMGNWEERLQDAIDAEREWEDRAREYEYHDQLMEEYDNEVVEEDVDAEEWGVWLWGEGRPVHNSP